MKLLGINPLLNFFNRQGKDEAYRAIAGRLLVHISELEDMPIGKAAELCYTSPATISRVAKKAGYAGYNDLKEEARKYCAEYFHENRIMPPDRLTGQDTADVYLAEVIRMYLELNRALDRGILDRAVEMIHEADAIYYFGSCDSARRFQQDLFIGGKYMEIFQTFSADKPALVEWQENSLAIVENPGYPWFECNDMVMEIKEKGIPVLHITCSRAPEWEEKVDLNIRFSGTRSGRDEVLYQALMAILSLEYRRRYIDSWYYQM